MSLSGMDAVAIRQIANDLDRQAHAVDGILGSVDNGADRLRSAWSGSDSEDFSARWLHQYRPGLVALIPALQALAMSCRRNADEQDRASGADTIGGVGVAGVIASGLARGVGGNPIGGFLRREASGIDHEARHVVSVSRHDAAVLASDEMIGFKEVLSSPQFAEVLGGLRIVAMATAFVPGLEPIAAVAGGLVLVGDVAEMANSHTWNGFQLATDVASVAVPSVSMLAKGGAAAEDVDAVDAASSSNLFAQAGTPARDVVDAIHTAPPGVTAVVSTRIAGYGVSSTQTTDEIGHDLASGHYEDAARDSMGYTDVIGGTSGGTAGSLLSEVSEGGQVVTTPPSAGSTEWVLGKLQVIGVPEQ